MAKFKCVACGGTYDDVLPDGMAYYHACPPEVIQHATFDNAGKLLTPEKRVPLEGARDERPTPGNLYVDGKSSIAVPNPEERGKVFFVESPPTIVSEGKGRTKI